MKQRTFDLVVRAWVLVSIVVGVGLAISGDQTISTVGVVLIIFGLVSLLPALRSTLGDWETDLIEAAEGRR